MGSVGGEPLWKAPNLDDTLMSTAGNEPLWKAPNLEDTSISFSGDTPLFSQAQKAMSLDDTLKTCSEDTMKMNLDDTTRSDAPMPVRPPTRPKPVESTISTGFDKVLGHGETFNNLNNISPKSPLGGVQEDDAEDDGILSCITRK